MGSGLIEVPVAIMALAAWLGAVLGDSLGYCLGRRFGRPWVTRRRRAWSRRTIAAAERFYDAHGWFAIVICRWFPGLRAVIPTLAGVGRMHPFAFTAANGIGALLWAVGMVLIGYAAAALPWVRDIALWAMAVSIALTAAYGVAHVVRRRRQSPPQVV